MRMIRDQFHQRYDDCSDQKNIQVIEVENSDPMRRCSDTSGTPFASGNIVGNVSRYCIHRGGNLGVGMLDTNQKSSPLVVM